MYFLSYVGKKLVIKTIFKNLNYQFPAHFQKCPFYYFYFLKLAMEKETDVVHLKYNSVYRPTSVFYVDLGHIRFHSVLPVYLLRNGHIKNLSFSTGDQAK